MLTNDQISIHAVFPTGPHGDLSNDAARKVKALLDGTRRQVLVFTPRRLATAAARHRVVRASATADPRGADTSPQPAARNGRRLTARDATPDG